MRRITWSHSAGTGAQIDELVSASATKGLLLVEFGPGGSGKGLPWQLLEPWTRSRAVTIAVAGGVVSSPTLDVALCSDLLYLRSGSRLRLSAGHGPPSPGIIWALGRAGRKALARGLLSTDDIGDGEAVDLGLAQAVLEDGMVPPAPSTASVTAATTARDLMRAAASGTAGLTLELAAFRLLFASGDPKEGAAAFIQKRSPSF